jgi:hypothetical protein
MIEINIKNIRDVTLATCDLAQGKRWRRRARGAPLRPGLVVVVAVAEAGEMRAAMATFVRCADVGIWWGRKRPRCTCTGRVEEGRPHIVGRPCSECWRVEGRRTAAAGKLSACSCSVRQCEPHDGAHDVEWRGAVEPADGLVEEHQRRGR